MKHAVIFGILFVLVFSLFVANPGPPAQASVTAHTFTVDSATDSPDSNPGDCICAYTVTGKCTLRAAVQESNACAGDDAIILAGGTTYPLGSPLTVTSSSEISIETASPGGTKAVISGPAADDAFVVNGSLSLDTIHVRNSKGITVNSSGALSGTSCEFSNNSGAHSSGEDMGGGAIWARGAVSLMNCTLHDNSTGNKGGAIFSKYANLTIMNTLIYANQAGIGGGGISYNAFYSSATVYNTLTIITSDIYSNHATWGGGLQLEGFTAPIGGGAFNVTLSSVRIYSNDADEGGGIYVGKPPGDERYGGVAVVNSEISGNTANDGAGMYIYNQSPAGMGIYHSTVIQNTTISGNSAENNGGGVYIDALNASVNFYNATISNNTADSDSSGAGQGGGIYQNGARAGTLKNTVVAGNKDLSSGTFALLAEDCDGDLKSAGNNLIGIYRPGVCDLSTQSADWYGSISAPLNPKLAPLSNTYKTDTYAIQFHALLPGSPALDTGSPDQCLISFDFPLTSDGRGEAARPRGHWCDRGAFESELTGVRLLVPLVRK